jgi:hypothetical protein
MVRMKSSLDAVALPIGGSDSLLSLPSSSAPLASHLDREGVEFMQFAFRWMNCLLMREISVKNTIRMWDTYLVRREALRSTFHDINPHSDGRFT